MNLEVNDCMQMSNFSRCPYHGVRYLLLPEGHPVHTPSGNHLHIWLGNTQMAGYKVHFSDHRPPSIAETQKCWQSLKALQTCKEKRVKKNSPCPSIILLICPWGWIINKGICDACISSWSYQHGRHFPDNILKCILLNENVWISIKISLKFVPWGPIDNIPALVQIIAWCRSGNKPLSELIMASLQMNICITQPQWVKDAYNFALIMIWYPVMLTIYLLAF